MGRPLLVAAWLAAAAAWAQPEYAAADMDTVLAKLRGWEGFRAWPYGDSGGQSVGYGHHLRKGEAFAYPMPEAVADSLLRADYGAMVAHAHAVTGLSGRRLLAVAALMYNAGTRGFGNTALCGAVTGGADPSSIWLRWCHRPGAGGSPVRCGGLLLRREWELAFYLSGAYSEQ